MILPRDSQTEDGIDIVNKPDKVIRFSVLKMVSPTEYIIRPQMTRSAFGSSNWEQINDANEIAELDARMQSFHKDKLIVLDPIELGKRCLVIHHQKFYRAEVIQFFEKR